MAKKVMITETILRDAHQSQAATRMRLDEMLPMLEKLDNVVIDVALDGEEDVVAVFLRKGRKIDTYTRYIDALPIAESGHILHFA